MSQRLVRHASSALKTQFLGTGKKQLKEFNIDLDKFVHEDKPKSVGYYISKVDFNFSMSDLPKTEDATCFFENTWVSSFSLC